MIFKHESVLPEETIKYLNIKPDGIYVDGTLGGAGHAGRVLEHLPNGKLIGIDQDAEALETARERLKPFADRTILVKDNFVNIGRILNQLKIEKVDGILLDIGVSSYQIDNPDRGFSYREDAPLDMRMDRDRLLTAKDVVNTYRKEDLTRIIREYGEEGFAANIAKHIVNEREKQPIETTGQLQSIIEKAIPAKVRKGKKGFAKKTFQAIRIEVNSELDVLKDSIDTMIDLLNPGGRLCIITFHSLEDRIVKNAFRRNEEPCTCPPDFPVCVCGKVPKGHVLTKRPVIPSQEECSRNKRATSAKLRVFEKAGI
ncbi:MAG: 16S rRNA (cytosine(1402)-N(4))-methyltransferase RsmH [Parasporobacterium sp.]|nr:16S rRNA (cytosine(1402)-N(4))-methyltransferase RsmH [Parasporobacterium sp.]